MGNALARDLRFPFPTGNVIRWLGNEPFPSLVAIQQAGNVTRRPGIDATKPSGSRRIPVPGYSLLPSGKQDFNAFHTNGLKPRDDLLRRPETGDREQRPGIWDDVSRSRRDPPSPGFLMSPEGGQTRSPRRQPWGLGTSAPSPPSRSPVRAAGTMDEIPRRHAHRPGSRAHALNRVWWPSGSKSGATPCSQGSRAWATSLTALRAHWKLETNFGDMASTTVQSCFPAILSYKCVCRRSRLLSRVKQRCGRRG